MLNRGRATHVEKNIVIIGRYRENLHYGSLLFADAADSGLQSCVTYCRLNFDPYLETQRPCPVRGAVQARTQERDEIGSGSSG